jgi:hypothetical protein
LRCLRALVAYGGAAYVLLLRATCRVRFYDDPRPALRARGERYAYAFLHAHQVATVVASERGTAAVVSRSADGDLLVPALRVAGVIPLRGSTRDGARDKGGSEALALLCAHVRQGNPAYLSVDGPRGPRHTVHRGVAALASDTGARILPAVAVARWRLIFCRTWDRMQLPLPGSRIDIVFAPPLAMGPADTPERVRAQVAESLAALEQRCDADEARVCAPLRNGCAGCKSEPAGSEP